MSDVSERTEDRELAMLVRTLERLTTRIELAFNPEIDEGQGVGLHDVELLGFVHDCRAVLDDPVLSSRLSAGSGSRW